MAIRPSEWPFLVITELKLSFTLDLVWQGVDRLAAADEVWLAVRATRKGRDRDSHTHKLRRLLGFGLLAVDPVRDAVEVLAEPTTYKPGPVAPSYCASTDGAMVTRCKAASPAHLS